MERTRILLKLTGNLLEQTSQGIDTTSMKKLAQQIKHLQDTITFGVVVGGGNFFRGARQSAQSGIREQTGHAVGMLATMMNGLIIQDIFEQENIKTTLFTAVPCDFVGSSPSPQALTNALENHHCLIFSGGTGNPYFSTDTTAVVRALQMGAVELWKGTNVDGVYSDDPIKNPSAEHIKRLSYKDALFKKLSIMDATAYSLAEAHTLPLRIFNIFTENALIHAAHNKEFGSTIDQTYQKGYV